MNFEGVFEGFFDGFEGFLRFLPTHPHFSGS